MDELEKKCSSIEISDSGEPTENCEATIVGIDVAPPSLRTEETTSDSNSPGNGLPRTTTKDLTKIDVYLKATGNAPIMKKKKWTVSQDQHIGWISEFIKKYLKLDPNERLFLYINQTFAPAPDQTVKNLYDCYGIDGKLVIHYCKSHAWG